NGSDNCSVASILASPTTLTLGVNTITWTVTDGSNNTATSSQTVTVVDAQDPTITTLTPITVNADAGVCTYASSQLAKPNGSDNCSVASILASPTTLTLGVNTVTWTVTDGSNNTATSSQTVTVVDAQNPTIICVGNQSKSADVGKCYYTVVGTEFNPKETADNCGVVSVSNNFNTSSTLAGAQIPTGTTIVWTVSDTSSNTKTCSFTVTVNDTQTPTPPVLPELIGECSLTVIPPTTIDNCGGIITGTTGTDLTFEASGSIFWIFTDASGNSTAPVEQEVTITDTGAPVPDIGTLPTQTINGCQISSISELTRPRATDDCEGTIEGTLSEGFQFPYSFYGTDTLTWEFIDSEGNISTQPQEIELIPVNIDGGSLKGTFESSVFSNQIDISSCGEAIAVVLNLGGEIGTIIHWEKFAENHGIWEIITDNDNTHTATFANGALESTYYRVLTQVGTCKEYSNIFYIRALPAATAPTVQNLDPDSDYCLGELVNLFATSNYLETEQAILDSKGVFKPGQLNTTDPDSWRIDGNKGGFSSGGNSQQPKNWSGTQIHTWDGITYDSQNVDNSGFAIAYGSQTDNQYKGTSPTTLETPILDLSNARTASLDFDQAYSFSTNDVAIIEISIDGGDSYSSLRMMHAAGSGNINWFDAGTAESYVGSDANNYNFKTDNTSISLEEYLGQSRVRIRWSFKGLSDKSLWALDNIFVNKQISVDTNLEWTIGIGNPDEGPITVGHTEAEYSFSADTPGHHQYGGTALINSCRTYSEEGTGLIDIYVSNSYAGEDIIFTSAECGQNTVQLNAYDNTISANDNNAKGAFPSPPANCIGCDDPGTGDIGVWSWTRLEAPTACITGSFSDKNDSNATFTGAAGTYTLSWTVNGCSNDITLTITDCIQVDFDGADDYVDFGKDSYDLSNISNKNPFSIEVWVKPESINGTQTIFSKRDANYSGNAKGYDLRINNVGEVSYNWDKTGSIDSKPYKIDTKRWYHIALTHSEFGEYKLYIDGAFIKLAGGGSPGENDNKAILGAMDKNGSSVPLNYFNGWMEEFRIWNVALTPEQLHQMMNQRIKISGSDKVKGEIIPLDICNLYWNNLAGYYRMDDTGCGNVNPYSIDGINYVGFKGKLKNITSSQDASAPLPYTSAHNGVWGTITTWGYLGVAPNWNPALWLPPNSVGVNGTTRIDWNIVKILNNNIITSGARDVTLLGLLSESGKLTMNGVTNISTGTVTGQGLWISNYLKLNGVIDLEGESQLVQKPYMPSQVSESVLEETSTGFIERDQQGTANSYNYNYWSSPVSLQGAANNSTYTVASEMLDGSPTINNGKPLSFNDWYEYADYTYASSAPRRVSNYWLYKFRGTSNVYSEWKHIGSTGILNAGEGYTMKGTSGNAAISDRQNYVFKGKPNNGTILLNIGKDQNYLLGNPYPSALDANKFILDNLNSANVSGATNTKNIFNGALYFWDHFAGKSHILLEYVGGYATRNLIGGLPAASTDERINANDSTGTKIPGQFIPVAQGFFINTVLDPTLSPSITVGGGDVIFKNSQRAFETERDTLNSQFLRPENNSKKDKQAEIRSKIRLDFRSPMGYNRQILVGSDPNTTNGFDLGYDAPLNDNNLEDMFWLIDNIEFVIQGVPNFGTDQVLPLGIKINEAGVFSIKINKLENVAEDVNIYLKNLQDSTYFDLRKGDFSMNLDPGNYYERFQIVFQNEKVSTEEPDPVVETEEEQEQGTDGTAGEEEILDGEIKVFYVGNNREIGILNPSKFEIERVVIYDMLGQIIQEYQNISNEKEVRLPVREFPAAVYAIKLYSGNKEISKSIILIR
ncbi:MAG: HYR domain-containing protein, partial [Flavobacterium sp.]|nr:HYR domain-containing protein [Flavobacterium sp.]